MVEKLELITAKEIQDSSGKWSKMATEAIRNCPKIKKEREVEILCDRFGIGKSPRTLHAIGQKYGVTRERIRQIVNNSLKKVQKNCLSTDLQKNIKLLENQVLKNGGLITKIALAESLGITDKQEQNALNFCASLSSKLYLQKESKNLKTGWSLKNIKANKIKDTSKQGVEVLRKAKKTLSTKEIAQELKAEPDFVAAVLGSTKETMLTDKNKWGLVSWPNVNPKSIRDKSKYIMVRYGKPMHYSDLTNKISEMGAKNVTKQSVHNELIKNQEFVLVGRGIYALSEWGFQPGVVEEVIVEVLETAGTPLHKNEIVKRVLERRIVKESTIVLNLQKDRFRRVDKAIYTLN